MQGPATLAGRIRAKIEETSPTTAHTDQPSGGWCRTSAVLQSVPTNWISNLGTERSVNIVTGQGEESTPAPRPEAAPDNVTWASALMSALSTPVSLSIRVGILSEHRGTAVAGDVVGLLTALVGILRLVRGVRPRRKRVLLYPLALGV